MGQQFRINEILVLLDSNSTHLPIGSHEWEVVASQQNENFPDKEQTGCSLRRKFTKLHKVKKPTGDPTCPAEVRYAHKLSANRKHHTIHVMYLTMMMII